MAVKLIYDITYADEEFFNLYDTTADAANKEGAVLEDIYNQQQSLGNITNFYKEDFIETLKTVVTITYKDEVAYRTHEVLVKDYMTERGVVSISDMDPDEVKTGNYRLELEDGSIIDL